MQVGSAVAERGRLCLVSYSLLAAALGAVMWLSCADDVPHGADKQAAAAALQRRRNMLHQLQPLRQTVRLVRHNDEKIIKAEPKRPNWYTPINLALNFITLY